MKKGFTLLLFSLFALCNINANSALNYYCFTINSSTNDTTLLTYKSITWESTDSVFTAPHIEGYTFDHWGWSGSIFDGSTDTTFNFAKSEYRKGDDIWIFLYYNPKPVNVYIITGQKKDLPSNVDGWYELWDEEMPQYYDIDTLQILMGDTLVGPYFRADFDNPLLDSTYKGCACSKDFDLPQYKYAIKKDGMFFDKIVMAMEFDISKHIVCRDALLPDSAIFDEYDWNEYKAYYTNILNPTTFWDPDPNFFPNEYDNYKYLGVMRGSSLDNSSYFPSFMLLGDTINVYYSGPTAATPLTAAEQQTQLVDVYTLTGALIMHQVKVESALQALPKGCYIMGKKKYIKQ